MKYSKKDQVRWNKPKKKTRADIPENYLQAQCERYLRDHDITFVRIPDPVYKWIFASGHVPVWVKRLSALYIKGLPDFTILYPDGRYICIELKTEIGRQSKGQRDFEKKVGSENYKIVRSYQEFKELMKNGLH